MSIMTFFNEFQNSEFPSEIKGWNTAEGFMFGTAASAPAAAAGYAPGAVVVRTDTKKITQNTGTKASPTWTNQV